MLNSTEGCRGYFEVYTVYVHYGQIWRYSKEFPFVSYLHLLNLLDSIVRTGNVTNTACACAALIIVKS